MQSRRRRATAAAYLDGRIQANPQQMPGRRPDFNPPAAAAIKAVLLEIERHANRLVWAPLQTLLDVGGIIQADGAAAGHAQDARDEAARRIIMNHENVMKDICNPSSDRNIEGKPLTQLELTRVPYAERPYADQCLREVVRRLLGRRPGSFQLVQKLHDNTGPMAHAWATTAEYLLDRIQGTDAEMPGREPDMSTPASDAIKAVLREVAATARFGSENGVGSESWGPLHAGLSTMSRNSGDNMMGGAADKHSAKAREEAAKKLINGHVPILRDVTNGAPVTQLELQRVPTDYARFVDEMMREVAWRLIGGQRSSPPARPTTPVQAQTWSMAAQYLQSRIAIPRDLGPEAGAAFKAVILEVATVALSSFGGAGNGAGDPQLNAFAKAAGVGGVAGGTWQQMFCAIAEQIPHAIVLVDMKVPGLPPHTSMRPSKTLRSMRSRSARARTAASFRARRRRRRRSV